MIGCSIQKTSFICKVDLPNITKKITIQSNDPSKKSICINVRTTVPILHSFLWSRRNFRIIKCLLWRHQKSVFVKKNNSNRISYIYKAILYQFTIADKTEQWNMIFGKIRNKENAINMKLSSILVSFFGINWTALFSNG